MTRSREDTRLRIRQRSPFLRDAAADVKLASGSRGSFTGSNSSGEPTGRTNARNKLAAGVELATPERERWIVQTESFYDARGRAYLDLADATPAEAERGMAMLQKLVG